MTLIQGTTKRGDEQYTPAWVFEALKIEFDLDPAHPSFKTSVPCKNYYTQKNDGLKQEWFGLVWCNPPYSQPKEWVNKFLDHNNGIMLLPMAKSKWFYELWNNPKVLITSLDPRIKFDLQDGKKNSIFTNTCLVAAGVKAQAALGLSNLGYMR
jgi:phage N-6-adenine-methyltransferase